MRDSVLKKLAHCELIIHAGDIGTPTTLDQLRSMGKVIAVPE
jgi:predicted phosphodiesterase